MTEQQTLAIPAHLGFILDGNRRWAKKHGLPTYEGHLAGYHALKEVVLKAADLGVKYVTVYAFSTENWKRSQDEVNGLMSLALRVFRTDIKELLKNEIRVRVLGAREGIPSKVLKVMEEAEEASKHFTRATFAVCFNYGGHREIVDAVKKCVDDGLQTDEIDETAIAERLYAPSIPPLDMIVRTSGEQRISNFMLWRAAYSEFYFMEKFWPDMRPADVEHIIQIYNRRNRRFGGN